jgi:hypothetical protein
MISWLIRDLGLVDLHAVVAHGNELTGEPALARAELHAAPDDAGEVLGLSQRPCDPR